MQEDVVYTFDDQFNLPPTAVGHIRCIRTKTMKYAVYFDESGSTFEYEMYDLAADAGELTNLLFGTPSSTSLAEWKRLHGCLTDRLNALGAMPQGITWPADPWGT